MADYIGHIRAALVAIVAGAVAELVARAFNANSTVVLAVAGGVAAIGLLLLESAERPRKPTSGRGPLVLTVTRTTNGMTGAIGL